MRVDGIDSSRSCPEERLDTALRVERGRPHQRLVEGRISPQVRLGQRRPFVRRLILGTDQRHSPVSALFAEGNGGSGAGQAGADDHVPRGHELSHLDL
jgi:hypothetical protein